MEKKTRQQKITFSNLDVSSSANDPTYRPLKTNGWNLNDVRLKRQKSNPNQSFNLGERFQPFNFGGLVYHFRISDNLIATSNTIGIQEDLEQHEPGYSRGVLIGSLVG